MTLKTKTVAGTIGDEFRQIHLIEGTKIAPIAKATGEFLAEWPRFQKLTRERQAAHIAKQYEKNAAKADAREAGRRGEKYDHKAAKKRLADAKSTRNELDLRFEEACGRIEQMIDDYRSLLIEHGQALRDEAFSDAEESVRTATTARTMADKALGGLDASLGVLGGLDLLAKGDHFAPKSARAGGRLSGSPIPHVGIAIDELTSAVTLAVEVLGEQKEAARSFATAALVEGTEDEDDWEDDEDDD